MHPDAMDWLHSLLSDGLLALEHSNLGSDSLMYLFLWFEFPFAFLLGTCVSSMSSGLVDRVLASMHKALG